VPSGTMGCSAGTTEMPVSKLVKKKYSAAILQASMHLELAVNTGSTSRRLHGTPVVPSTPVPHKLTQYVPDAACSSFRVFMIDFTCFSSSCSEFCFVRFDIWRYMPVSVILKVVPLGSPSYDTPPQT
jgi:hypothetical protein